MRLEYRHKSASETGGYVFEVVSAAESGGVLRAHCRHTPLSAQKPYDFTLVKDSRGVHRGRALELPLPARPGRRWARAPYSYRVDALDAVKTVPAGTFRGCLRVAYLVAGGDAGRGERLYAPGVGLICEICADETDPFELLLTRAVLPAA